MSQKFMTIGLAALVAVGLQAADKGAGSTDAVPGLKARLATVEAQIKAKNCDAAEQALLAIEKEPGLDDAAKAQLDYLFMTLYGTRTGEGNRSPKRDGVKELEFAKKIAANSVADTSQKTDALTRLATSTDFGRQYGTYYLNAGPEAEVEKMRQDNQAYLEQLVRVNPTNAAGRIALGNLYVRAGAGDKAAAEFTAALALPDLSPEQPADTLLRKINKAAVLKAQMQWCDALTGLASAALLKGDRAAAISACEKIVGRNLKIAKSGRGSRNPVELAQYAIQFMKGSELDYLKLPYDNGAKAFPTPQQAVYQETFVPLKAVKLVLGKDIASDDVRLRLLRTKFGRFGIGLADDAPFTITINAQAEPKAPDKAEGYALTVTRDGAVINSHDPQGTLWGIVSLIQLVDRSNGPKIRLAEIVDYPATAVRGFLQSNWKDALEYMLFSKMNAVVSQTGPQVTHLDPLIPWSPLQKEICAAMSEAFAAFGLTHYYGIDAWTMFYKLPLSSERTFDLHVQICSEIAKNGGGIYFPYDDMRFPLPQADLDKFGSAAAVDAPYLTRLFQAVKKQNPNFKMIFCPPFYWGPDSPAAYPEPREPYLKSLGEFLDPAIGVFWTGPRVKGYQKTPEQTAWFAGLTKRKPLIYQNGSAPHNTLSYITDVTPGWRKWHYDGFFENDIAGFLKNAEMGEEAAQTATLADALWNTRAYDATGSIRRACALLYGKTMFDLIDPANRALGYLDKYPYGELTPEAAAEIPEIERRVKIAEEAYAKGVAYNAFALEQFPGKLGKAVEWYRNALQKVAKGPPDFYKKYAAEIESVRADAAKEVGIDAVQGDLFKSPVDMAGGKLMVYDNQCPARFTSVLYGKNTASSRVKTGFECDPFPPSGDYALYLSAQDDEREAQCAIRIAVNGKALFEGPNPFAQHGWSVAKYAIPFGCLQRANELTVENIEDSDNAGGAPWVMINYAVIKKTAR